MSGKNHSSFLTSHFSLIKSYPLSLLCIILIGVLSLAPYFPETPLDDVRFIDKWTHLVMYGGTCSVVWWEHLRNCKKETRKLVRACGQRHIIHFSLLSSSPPWADSWNCYKPIAPRCAPVSGSTSWPTPVASSSAQPSAC